METIGTIITTSNPQNGVGIKARIGNNGVLGV